MDQLYRISEVIYVSMWFELGSPIILPLRRDVMDIKEVIKTQVQTRNGIRSTVTGSKREGFTLLASDVDLMNWPTDHHVIWDLNHADQYNKERCTLILMEYSKDHPGFTMLQLVTPTNNFCVRQSCVRRNYGLYISSTKYRENTLPSIMDCSFHGPCARGKSGNLEFDIAHSFECIFWPSIATRFIQRCFIQRWPPNYIVGGIVNSGCHVVPIGFKGSSQEDHEWRISFSKAENKLVYCMNHTQFVCYGLLKLFLKEVLTVKDTNGEPLLCSYFMKTVLFWVIQNNTLIDWNPSSLLSGFWLCFKFLLSSVYHGVLPNFFIPENNMFISKIFGHSQKLCYERLFDLYNIGISCLLNHQLVRSRYYLNAISSICNGQIVLNPIVSKLISQYNLNGLLREIDSLCSFDKYSNTGHCFATLNTAIRCIQSRSISPWQHVALRKLISKILRCIVYHLYDISSNLYNKSGLRIMNACFNLLKVSVKMGCISDKIYLALLLYSVGKNYDAITNLTMIKTIIARPLGDPIGINTDTVGICGDIDSADINDDTTSYTVYLQRYIQEVGGRTPSEIIRGAVAKDISLGIPVTLKELELEYRLTTYPFMSVPPYVITLMLLVLCFRGDPNKQQEALYELFIIVHYDEGRYIPEKLRDISWQILGICQQICGNHQEALLSYQNSLKQIPFNDIQRATYYRIKDAQIRIQNS